MDYIITKEGELEGEWMWGREPKSSWGGGEKLGEECTGGGWNQEDGVARCGRTGAGYSNICSYRDMVKPGRM